MNVTINGENRRFEAPLTVTDLLAEIGLDPAKVALERNLAIVPRSAYASTRIEDGDRLEVVHFIGGGAHIPRLDGDPLIVAGRTFHSRLIVGTGKYKDFEETRAAIEASGAEMV